MVRGTDHGWRRGTTAATARRVHLRAQRKTARVSLQLPSHLVCPRVKSVGTNRRLMFPDQNKTTAPAGGRKGPPACHSTLL